MGLTRRQLPIASPCQEFVGRRATATEPAYCTRCEKNVHDLSRLTEPEVITLLARNIGKRVCVSYRTGADGSIAMRPTPSRFAPAALAVSLAGCAGHMSEVDRTASADCVDESGYDTACPPKPRLADAVIPDANDANAVEPDAIDPGTTPAIDTSDRDVVGEMVPPADGADPSPLYPDVDVADAAGGLFVSGDTERGEIAYQDRTAGSVMLDPKLERRIAREAKRLERREARAEARAQKRLARR
ncbi:MAG TPA: hypothetical protein VG755_21460 [Nannocystaceae bacterium]|nr:hypothetical protein [Nannocystaceae bacterium]